MTNESEVETTTENELDLDLDLDVEEAPKKQEETAEAKLARLERQIKQQKKKMGVEEKLESKSKTGELGYAELAYLSAKKIDDDDEIELVQDYLKNTGKSLKDVLVSKHFQAELKEMRESKSSDEAVPKGTRRSGNTSRNTVEYWLSRDENPPDTAENRQLRIDVVNARMKAQADASPFVPGGKLIIK